MVEQSCSSHDGQEAEKERWRVQRQGTLIKGMFPSDLLPLTQPDLLQL
jgi:hypothetical protein